MGFFDFLWGGKNPANDAMKYYNQIPGQAQQQYQPYINAGQNAMNANQQQYMDLINNPGGKLNQIGESFHESPGFKFAMQQALQGAGHAAAAGGMAGSPQHEQWAQGLATNLANQDYYNWLQGATGLYGGGLQGNENIANRGFQSSRDLADILANNLGQQGDIAFRGGQERNNRMNDFFGGVGRGIGALGAFTPWGKAGGAFDTAYNRLYPNG